MRAVIRKALAAASVSLAFGGVTVQPAAAAAAASDADAVAQGRAIYMEGRRGSDLPLLAHRSGGLSVRGAEAACVNCHRRSGLGDAEGRSYIPPITADSLFKAMTPGTGASASGIGRPAYTDQSLAQAIRGGVDPTGRSFDYLMPRYELQEDDARALIAYLRQLADQPAADSESKPLDFATVVAPGMAPEDTKAMTEVLQACFADHNAGPAAERGRKKLAPSMSMRNQRKWNLHVWQLAGEPESWTAQLAEHARQQPVFAMVGGLGGGDWAPVHDFCERDALPCLFPHVEAPVVSPKAFYPLYLSGSVLLEAGIIAKHLTGDEQGARRVIQVLRSGDDGAGAGAQALRRALADHGIEVQERRIAAAAPIAPELFAGTSASDAVVLWLRSADLKRLDAIAPVDSQVFASATLAQEDSAPIPAAWKARTLMPYPFELPQKRTGRLHAWLQAHHLPVTSERVQADAYVACSTLAAGMNEVADHMHGDYLMERLESIMERGAVTGLYPRLTLGVGQRFASKTGYLVRFQDGDSPRLVPVGDAVAP